jgi:hypothetical protein
MVHLGGKVLPSIHIPDIGSGTHSDFYPTITRSFYPFYSVGESIVTEDYLLPSLGCVELNSSVFFMAGFVTNTEYFTVP